MYLISIYFDEKTNAVIQRLSNRIAEKTGNPFMTEGKVPPHITISAFETKREAQCVELLECLMNDMKKGKITWASVGQFFPYVIYLTPVLNFYLHEMACLIYEKLSKIEETIISPYYQPFQWLPHTTVGKKLSAEQMRIAFEVLQESFAMFEGSATAIGLARTNPYREIVRYEFV